MCCHLMKVLWFASQTLASTWTGPESFINFPGCLTPGGSGTRPWCARPYLEVENVGNSERSPANVSVLGPPVRSPPSSESPSSSTPPPPPTTAGDSRADDCFVATPPTDLEL